MLQFLKDARFFFKSAVKVDVTAQHPYRHMPFLLVTGMGRSGTTAVRNLVAAHPGIDARNAESNTLFDFLKVADKHARHPNRSQLMSVSRSAYLDIVANALLQIHWPDPWPEDRPPNAISTFSVSTPATNNTMKEMFPQTRFCYVLRNGIEVISSRLKFGKPPFSEWTFEEHCEDWATRVQAMLQWAASRDDVFIFRHEWLVKKDTALRAVEQLFPGIDPGDRDQMVDSISGTEFNPTRFDGESADSRADLSQRSQRFALWTNEQRQYFLEHCGDIMRLAGYELPK